jgi:predicted protein tyrosine phosphatase
VIKVVVFVPGAIAEKMTPCETDGIISINEINHTFQLSNLWNYKLVMRFDDLDTEVDSVDNREPVLFNDSMANEIIDWLEANKNNIKTLVVNCNAGISRSAAVAKFVADIYKLDFNEKYSLYNKHVYSTLRKEWDRRLYER